MGAVAPLAADLLAPSQQLLHGRAEEEAGDDVWSDEEEAADREACHHATASTRAGASAHLAHAPRGADGLVDMSATLGLDGPRRFPRGLLSTPPQDSLAVPAGFTPSLRPARRHQAPLPPSPDATPHWRAVAARVRASDVTGSARGELESRVRGVYPGDDYEAGDVSGWGAGDPDRFLPPSTLKFHERHFRVMQYVYEVLPGTGVGVGGASSFACSARVVARLHPPPSVAEVFALARLLYKTAQLTPECAVVCLVYVERLMRKTNLLLLGSTWRPVLVVSLLLASKVWQDLCTWNAEFTEILGLFPLRAMNELEQVFVASLGYELRVSPAEFGRYYFALRSMTEQPNFRRKYIRLLSGRGSGGRAPELPKPAPVGSPP